VAAEREEDPRRARSAAEAAREGADRGSQVDRVLHAAADVLLREVTEGGARGRERLDAAGADSEPERLGEHDDRVEDAAEGDRDGDRERDVPARVVGLFPEGGGA